jgi:hypothetical protein
MIERINAFAARHLGGVGTSGWSFVRIHVWAVVFLVVIAAALPDREPDLARTEYNRIIDNPRVADLGLDRNDPRGFAESPYGERAFRAAWISGSEIQLIDDGYYEFLPELVVEELPRVDGRRTAVDLYFLSAMRLGDAYLALLDAIESDPDVIVFSLNPAWVLNPIAVHEWENLEPGAARSLLSDPGRWPLALSLLSPSDVAWGLVGAEFDQFADRWHYGAKVRSAVSDWDLLDRTVGVEPVEAEPDVDPYAEVLASRPVDFWYRHRLPALPEPGPLRWAELVASANDADASLNRWFLRAVGDALVDSGIPSYVYLTPANQEWVREMPEVAGAVADLERLLAEVSPSFEADHVMFEATDPGPFLAPMTFKDLVHLGRADPLAAHVSEEICGLLRRQGHEPECGPSGGAAQGDDSNG